MGKGRKHKKALDNVEERISDGANKLIEQIKDDKNLTKWQKHRRKRAVKKTRVLFRAIDVLFSLAQNSCPYVKKSDESLIDSDTDIIYDNNSADICKLDYYGIKSDERRPAVIIIHGGGFTAGDKKYRRGKAQFLALNGFNVFCVNYGLAPDFAFPQPIAHIVSAANFIYDNAEKFNIDKNRIMLDGDSAGAYYAVMLAALKDNEKLKSLLNCELKFKVFGAMLNCGVYDMNTVRKIKDPFDIADGIILSLTGSPLSEFDSYEHRDCCMPVDFITSDFPPTFLIYSDADIFCRGQGDVLKEMLENNNVYYEYYLARHITSNHCFSLTWSGEDAAAANELMMSFAKRLASDKIKL